MEGLTEGRMVHFVPGVESPEGSTLKLSGRHRPAIIVHVWNDAGVVNLYVLCDPTQDGQGITFATSVRYDENKSEGTWHWIEKA